MAKLIIEVINRLGHSTERFKIDELPIRIGRAYNNDIILSDPHVSPEHLFIRDGDEQWQVEDCGSLNGVQIKHHSNHSDAMTIHSGDDVIIGRTRLRFYSPWHPIPETHVMPTGEYIEKLIGRPIVALSLFLLTMIVLIVNSKLLTSTTVATEKLIASALPVMVSVLAWAGIWAFAGRVMRHRTHFLTHFSITTLFAISLVILNNMGEYIAFITNSALASRLFEFLLMGLCLFTLLNVNIENATSAARKTRYLMSHTLTWGLLIFSMFMDYASQPDFVHSPRFPAQLKPPFAKLAPSVSYDEFIKDSKIIFAVKDSVR